MIGFDTLKASLRLQEEADFDEHQAHALVNIFAEGIGEDMATRDDLEKTEMSLRSEIQALRGDLEKTEASLRSEIQAVRSEVEVLRGEVEVLRGDLEENRGISAERDSSGS